MQKTRTGREFELIGGHSALDLVNTLDWRFRVGGQEELLGSYEDLVNFAAQSGLLTSRQIRHLLRSSSGPAGQRVLVEVRALREALSDLIYAGIDRKDSSDPSLLVLERFFAGAQAQTSLSRNGAGLKWEWGPEAETKSGFPLWLLTRSAAQLMFSGQADLVRACSNAECRWLFLDTSKNHTRRWCDMKICGNRMKARRFRASRSAD